MPKEHKRLSWDLDREPGCRPRLDVAASSGAEINVEGRMSHSERMSSVDTTWLRMDRPANLMMIVAVWVLEGPVALDKVEKQIADGLLELPALSPEGRVYAGRRLLARRPEFRPRPSHQAGEAARTRRQAGARALRRRARVGAARSQPSAVDRAYRRKIRRRGGCGVPHASRDRRRHGADGRHHGAGRRARAQGARRQSRRTRTKAGCRP